ncbi:Rrf2 family transcriptional regulator [Peribacillus sp. CSMR9]|uniref:RrF2 family transcriptional regulator n=1 Tax=Peribacillus sp. CSMR9 TaxID=2981350 RepID=UPI0029544549|nr:Rrf2 family transcriptional regulator [Peribacillus sp. CSMR9]MDV7767594.1 Rrf2 family transcriptional regulator [Peribacillus sp. CSMR9]
MSEKVSSIMWFSLAVQALLVLADQDGLCNSAKLADKLDSESGFLRKILSNLVKAGLIQAKEGRDGGYSLAKNPEQIILADIYAAIKSEPFSKGFLDVNDKKCFHPSSRDALCGLKNEMESWIIQGLEQKTIADLLSKS